MVLFDTNSKMVRKNLLILQQNSYHAMIANLKYSLGGKEQANAAGFIHSAQCNGRLIDTNGCTVLLVTAGYAIVEINFIRHALSRGDVVFLFYDDVFILSRSSAQFSAQFVSIALESVEDVFHKLTSNALWDFLYEKPVLRTNHEQWALLIGWMQQIDWIIREEVSPYRNELLRSSMLNLFMAVHTEVIRSGNESSFSERNRSWLLAMKFWKMLVKHCREHRDVQFYAASLCITTTYLYKLTQKEMLTSPKELIDQQIVTQIKTYLANTDYTIGQIAAEFHFEDVSYFCRFFRRMTGLSPMEFRNGFQK